MTLPFSTADLLYEVQEGNVTARPHKVYPYTIYNYADKVQFSDAWNDVTLNCRGLILNDEFHVMARPWSKFFNLGQRAMRVQPTDKVEVMDKADGSLGILYPTPEGGFAVSTRGSFHSEQAEHATELWNERYADTYNKALYQHASPFTFLFEIIYPENQIVLNYGDMDDLILLGAVDKYYGYYHGPREAAAFLEWQGPVVQTFEYNTISDALANTGRPNAEGFVIKAGNYLVKIKQPDYLEMHKLKFELTPKRIWEHLSQGHSLEHIVVPLPDEFQDQVMAEVKVFKKAYAVTMNEVLAEWNKVKHLKSDRPAFAKEAKTYKHRAALFMLLDGRSIDQYIWKLLKPKVEPIKEYT